MIKLFVILLITTLCWSIWYMTISLVESNEMLSQTQAIRNNSQDEEITDLNQRLNGQGMFLRNHLDKKEH